MDGRMWLEVTGWNGHRSAHARCELVAPFEREYEQCVAQAKEWLTNRLRS